MRLKKLVMFTSALLLVGMCEFTAFWILTGHQVYNPRGAGVMIGTLYAIFLFSSFYPKKK